MDLSWNVFADKLSKSTSIAEPSPPMADCSSFAKSINDVQPKAKYDDKVRQAVINRILVDKLNATTVQQAMQRDFLCLGIEQRCGAHAEIPPKPEEPRVFTEFGD